ncbi:LysR family transcriptional regulator [Methylobacterium symbioticum]|uniref:HTH-type transcriptional activator AllS n=1 Tax=Methylobacterium symbioticum TaxID=2584084 RepID=A0A509EA51_9HYPH|nr:LysR family transcriptional regulator [Methylobacterium symbioticum]VUD71050.1 HTH-type transcriptional activator AllS [Methylobacterium symbioticum]
MIGSSRTLDADAIQAFVLVADLASFTRAAEALGTSQAAVSLRLKRLEDRLGHRLIERTPRQVRLSARGEAFLPAARDLLLAQERAWQQVEPTVPRRLVLGISDHVAGPELPVLIGRIAAQDPALVIEVRVARSQELIAAYDRGRFDAVIVRNEDGREDGRLLAREVFGWFAAPGFRHRTGEPLRLATMAEPCGVRETAARLLDAAGLPWTEVFVGGGVLAVAAAVSAGLGIAALARRVAPTGAVEVGAAFGLPALPLAEVVLHARPHEPRTEAVLRLVGATFRSAEPA